MFILILTPNPLKKGKPHGDRLKEESSQKSDLNIVVFSTPEQQQKVGGLRGAFEESDLPFRVVLSVWCDLPKAFREQIKADREMIQSQVVAQRNEEIASAPLNTLSAALPISTPDWLHCTVAEVCSSIDYGLTKSALDQPIGQKFLRITDIMSGQIDWNTVPYVAASNEIAEKYKLYHGDIVLAHTGTSTGASAYIKNPPPAVFASHLARLQTKSGFDARFLAYYLRLGNFTRYINGVVSDKSAQPNASASTMTAASLCAPGDLREQRMIAHILGTLDDKIELNRFGFPQPARGGLRYALLSFSCSLPARLPTRISSLPCS